MSNVRRIDRTRHLRRRLGHAREEGGMVAVWVAILLIVLIAFAGMASDIGYVTWASARAQRTVDAAALAGVVYLPGDLTTAQSEALKVATVNGTSTGLTIVQGAKTNQLKVTMDATVPSLFSRVVGIKGFQIRKSATAELAQTLAMGSPSATLGNDPESGAQQPNFWIRQNSPANQHHNGDRYGSDNCNDDSSDSVSPAYGCSVNSDVDIRGKNVDFTPSGYQYVVNASSPAPGDDLSIEVFDPIAEDLDSRCTSSSLPTGASLTALNAWVPDASTRYQNGSGTDGMDWCTGDGLSANETAIPNQTQFTVTDPDGATVVGSAVTDNLPVIGPLVTAGSTVSPVCSQSGGSQRYVKITNNTGFTIRVLSVGTNCVTTSLTTVANGSSYTVPNANSKVGWRLIVTQSSSNAVLTGTPVSDFTVTSSYSSSSFSPTTFTYTNGPSYTASAPTLTGGTATCQRTSRPYNLDTYSAGDPYSGTITQLVNPSDGVRDNGAGTRDAIAQEFVNGFRRWVTLCRIPAAQVRTGAYTVTVRTDLEEPNGGTTVNAFSLRAAYVDPVDNSRTTSGVSVYGMQRLPVFVNLGGSTTTDLYMVRVLPTHAGRHLTIDVFDMGDVSSGTETLQYMSPADGSGNAWSCGLTKLWGTSSSSSLGTTCTIANISRTNYNGSLLRFDIDIPNNYSCDPTIITNCWTKMRVTFNGAVPTDQTTWSATLDGDPLRLVA